MGHNPCTEAHGEAQEQDQLPPVLPSCLRSLPFPDLGTAGDCQSHLSRDCCSCKRHSTFGAQRHARSGHTVQHHLHLTGPLLVVKGLVPAPVGSQHASASATGCALRGRRE